MIWPCNQRAECRCDDSPVMNLSVELPDPVTAISIRYWPVTPDIRTYLTLGCLGWCLSEVSQQDADLCAARQAATCAGCDFLNNEQTCYIVCEDGWNSAFTMPAGLYSGCSQEEADAKAYAAACVAVKLICGIPPDKSFYNTAQTCTVTCSDGSTQSYTVPAGVWRDTTQAAADKYAYNLACELAVLFCVPQMIYQSTAQDCTVWCPNGTESTYEVAAGFAKASTQEAADAAAHQFACQMVAILCNPAPSLFWNAAQTCSSTCLDGTVQTSTVPANTVASDVSQADADSQAFALACQLVTLQCPPVPGLFWNTEQCATATCPDGSTSEYCVPAHSIAGRSQEEADALAKNFAIQDAKISCSLALYGNDPQFCSLTCPSGQVSSFTVPANWIFAGDKKSANSIAYAHACAEVNLICANPGGIPPYWDGTATCPDGTTFTYRIQGWTFSQIYANWLAKRNLLCLGDIPDSCCVGSEYLESIQATGKCLAAYPFYNYWEISSGTLPDGLTLEGGFTLDDFVIIQGTPTATGTFAFTVKVTCPNGTYMAKNFSVVVAGITNTPLPGATVGTPYSVQLTQYGYTDPWFSVDSGTLPAGLTLDNSGLLSGTPTTVQSAGFTIAVEEAP